MSFDRYRSQKLCESFLGCTSFEDFYGKDFESLTLDSSKAYAFKNSLKEDAVDLFYKGYLSLFEGLEGYQKRFYSWAVIKCYYSVFYMLKADLAIREFGLIRHKAIYILEAKDGSTPFTKGRNGANRSKYSGDHKSVINYYYDFFKNSDILLSQNIDSLNSYEWLMKKREQVHYQEKHFNEPNFPDFLSYIDNEISAGKFNNLIEEILSDTLFIKTFQNEYAPIAIPIKRALLTQQKFIDNSILLNFTDDQIKHLKSFRIYDLLNK